MGTFILNVFKILFAIILLPVVVTSLLVFQEHLFQYPTGHKTFFLWGALAFLITFLFVYQFWGFYEIGQKVTKALLRFLAPLDYLLAYVIPCYFTLIMIGFFLTKVVLDISWYDHYFLFFAGFSLAMHIFLSAQELQQGETTPIKPSYFLTICVVVIGNIFIAVLLLDLVFHKFTFLEFFNQMSLGAREIYLSCFERIKVVG